ncbi:MAG: peptidylprolyl isomerase [Candidatus Fervidibacter sp.]|uniref:peptidylprolyl isomerase n=1 Tax=Candidatus Fervidibacter sp. TaxID=3100871 RepID=UPI00404A4561
MRYLACLLLGTLMFMFGCKREGKIIARADGIVVTERELRGELWRKYGSITLKELVQRKLIEREARRRNISVAPDEISQALKQHGLPDSAENRQRVKTELLLEKLANAMVEVSEVEARRFYEQNKALYEQPERVRLRDITLESRENAEAIWKALQLRKGDNFPELARHFSINPATRTRGGDTGIIPVNDLHPELRNVVKRLKVGEFSRPVNVDGEWVIVKLEERFPAEQKTFEQVKEQVFTHLRRQKAWQLRMELPSKLWREANVKIFDPSLKENKR